MSSKVEQLPRFIRSLVVRDLGPDHAYRGRLNVSTQRLWRPPTILCRHRHRRRRRVPGISSSS